MCLKRTFRYSALAAAIALTGCGGGSSGGGGGSSTSLSGGGVKGPMANAAVSAFRIDTSADGFRGELVATGSTNERAEIVGLSVSDLSQALLLEFNATEQTTDITSGEAPVISSLKTVLTPAMLASGDSVYATPLTTVATDLAMANADKNNGVYAGDGNGTVTEQEFLAALPVAASQVSSSLGFGMPDTVDIFTTPPLVNDDTDTSEEQGEVAAYRTAVEALSAVVVQLEADARQENAQTTVSTDLLLGALAEDMSDGEIDGLADGEAVSALGEVSDNVATVVVTDPNTLTIPGTNISVADVEEVLVTETETTGAEVDVSDLEDGTIDVDPEPAEVIPDTDGDGFNDEDDNCPVVSNENQQNNDRDDFGNACDADDDNDGVDDQDDAFPLDPFEQVDTDGDQVGNNEDTDDDNDGVADEQDAFPLDRNESVDTDGDDIGNNADTDDDNDGVADEQDAFPLDRNESLDTDGDSIGNNADTDDDNDRVPDEQDAFPLDRNESVDTDGNGVGNNADPDDDGDGVLDEEDAFPLDETETTDSDGDGQGDNSDSDIDGDQIENDVDNCPTTPNPDQDDSDEDGIGDSCDDDNGPVTGVFGTSTWDNATFE